MVLVGWMSRKKLETVPRGIQNFGEYVAEQLNAFTTGIIGPHGAKYTPLIGTLFLYILLSNLIGLIPGFHSPTANLSMTFAIAIVIFIFVQIEGLRSNGILGRLKHFFNAELGLLMIPIGIIELISEIIKPFTLAIRLFGNIFGEDVIVVVLSGLLAGSVVTAWMPIQFPILVLALLTSFVQAMVFSILACIYLSLATSHEH